MPGSTKSGIVVVGILMFLLALMGLAVLYPEYGEICKYSQDAGQKECPRYSLPVFIALKIGPLFDVWSAFITAVATGAMAAFTWTIRGVSIRQLAHLRDVERAYVSGGGPLTADHASFVLSINNYGKTPALLQTYSVGFCSLTNIPATPDYSQRSPYQESIAPNTRGRPIGAIEIPPFPRPMLVYGRFWFLDVWQVERSGSFVLVVEDTGTHGHVPSYVPRSYFDWD